MKPGSGVGGTGNVGRGKIFEYNSKTNTSAKSAPRLVVDPPSGNQEPRLVVDPRGGTPMYPGGSKNFDERTGKVRPGMGVRGGKNQGNYRPQAK